MKRNQVFNICAAFVIVLAVSAPVTAQLEKTQLVPNVTVVSGGGGNSGIIVGEKAVLVVDTKTVKNSEGLYTIVKEIAGTKPIIVVNTHYHQDHVGGNHFYKGSKIYTGSYPKDFLQANIDTANWPTNFVSDSLLIDLGDENVLLYQVGRAHTTNDLVVYLPKHRILFSGDLIFNKINPVVMEKSGANISQWIAVLDRLLDNWSSGTVVPGHGPVGDKAIVAAMHDYFTDMTAAAMDTSKQNSVVEKYQDWMKLPNMSSPEKTIEYIRMSEGKK
jgi:glyoxylase-like metal-dependent hydrolase (beta-lactamase superfamily II)